MSLKTPQNYSGCAGRKKLVQMANVDHVKERKMILKLKKKKQQQTKLQHAVNWRHPNADVHVVLAVEGRNWCSMLKDVVGVFLCK